MAASAFAEAACEATPNFSEQLGPSSWWNRPGGQKWPFPSSNWQGSEFPSPVPMYSRRVLTTDFITSKGSSLTNFLSLLNRWAKRVEAGGA